MVNMPACHAGDRGFESRQLRQNKSPLDERFFYAHDPPAQPAARKSGPYTIWT